MKMAYERKMLSDRRIDHILHNLYDIIQALYGREEYSWIVKYLEELSTDLMPFKYLDDIKGE